MGLKDLNIEFEDENERNKSNAIEPTVELNFAASPDEVRKSAAAQGKVVDIRGKGAAAPARSSAISTDTIETILSSLTNSIIDSEKEKRKYLVQIISESKLFEHKLNGVLNKLVKTSPDSKQDLLMIKKLVTDFLKIIEDN